jgi:hypothetical protein
MAQRRLGPAQISRIATVTDVAEAIELIARSPYGHDVLAGGSVSESQWGIAATLLWNLRVLAGWLPAAGANMLRALAGWFEIANIDEHLSVLSGATVTIRPFRLGSLATAWSRLAVAGSLAELRTVLDASAWGDPGTDEPGAIGFYLRLAWADRVASSVPRAREWAAGGTAILIAKERFLARRTVPAAAATIGTHLLGARAADATSLSHFAAALPVEARWTLADIDSPDALWRAEARWWNRLYRDGRTLLAGTGFGAARPLGAIALLAFDAWQAQAALEVASRGGAGREVLDEAS